MRGGETSSIKHVLDRQGVVLPGRDQYPEQDETLEMRGSRSHNGVFNGVRVPTLVRIQHETRQGPGIRKFQVLLSSVEIALLGRVRAWLGNSTSKESSFFRFGCCTGANFQTMC
jgi:hypothetical protein